MYQFIITVNALPVESQVFWLDPCVDDRTFAFCQAVLGDRLMAGVFLRNCRLNP